MSENQVLHNSLSEMLLRLFLWQLLQKIAVFQADNNKALQKSENDT